MNIIIQDGFIYDFTDSELSEQLSILSLLLRIDTSTRIEAYDLISNIPEPNYYQIDSELIDREILYDMKAGDTIVTIDIDTTNFNKGDIVYDTDDQPNLYFYDGKGFFKFPSFARDGNELCHHMNIKVITEYPLNYYDNLQIGNFYTIGQIDFSIITDIVNVEREVATCTNTITGITVKGEWYTICKFTYNGNSYYILNHEDLHDIYEYSDKISYWDDSDVEYTTTIDRDLLTDEESKDLYSGCIYISRCRDQYYNKQTGKEYYPLFLNYSCINY